MTAINHKLDYEVKQCKTVKAILDKEPENLDLDFYRAAYRATDACERAFQDANDAIKALVDSLKNPLVSNLNLNSFYEYLNSLSLLELSALYHLIVLMLICLISFNILSAVFR